MSFDPRPSSPRKRGPGNIWLPAALALAIPLAACNTAQSHIGEEDPGLGEAVRYNAAIQTINPAPVYTAEGAQPGDNGEKGVNAVKRCRTDKVKDTVSQRTSSGAGGGGGSH